MDPEDPFGMPVADVILDAKDEQDAVEKAKVVFREQLTTLEGLHFDVFELKD